MTRGELMKLNKELKKDNKKYCSKCEVVKNLNDFEIHSKTTYRSHCKVCRKVFYKKHYNENKERINSYIKEWIENNPDKVKKSQKKYMTKNKEKLKILRKEYENSEIRLKVKQSKEYKEKRRVESKKWYNNNKVKSHKSTKKWLDKNRESHNDWLRQYNKERRKDPEIKFHLSVRNHLKTQKTIQLFKDKWDDIRQVYDMYGVDYHIDHKIPVTWFKITTDKRLINNIKNLQVIDSFYNQSKCNRWSDKVSNEYYQLIKGQIKNEYKDKLKQTQL